MVIMIFKYELIYLNFFNFYFDINLEYIDININHYKDITLFFIYISIIIL